MDKVSRAISLVKGKINGLVAEPHRPPLTSPIAQLIGAQELILPDNLSCVFEGIPQDKDNDDPKR